MSRFYAGQVFGKLTAIEKIESVRTSGGAHYSVWLFQCACGNQVTRGIESLDRTTSKGHIASCGCFLKERAESQAKELISVGDRFGMLTAVKYVGMSSESNRKDSKRFAVWLFKCDCGGHVEHSSRYVKYRSKVGQRLHCGCSPTNKKSDYGARNKIIRGYIESARNRGLVFELTEDQMINLFAGNCAYCGREPSQVSRSGVKLMPFVYNGIDRVDNSLGYLPSNVVSCCKWCNYAKLKMGDAEFAEWLERITDYRIQLRHAAFKGFAED